ncbi:nitrite reductase (NO-forming) [Flavobacterium gillisiae]|uniref:Nitrite reductase (NO-forming) n=1 Tax=Flavobacterium gillisiae TaxID=150146 RepID=A0A1H4BVD6_9FLAO|nr:cytochrome c [Flavobacterium gillisiae]SEA52088.1 nitrite reductase (NO-forming) [Flavobacterium gillisiae]
MKKYILGISVLTFMLFSFNTPVEYLTIKSSPEQQVSKGKLVYNKVCMSCHQMNGAGISGAFPPLAKSDYLNADVNRAIEQILNGSNGPITVNGKKYTTPMPKQELTDQQVADVLTYVYGNWGNNKSVVTPEMVKKLR